MVSERRLERSKGTSFADYEEDPQSFVSLPYSDLKWQHMPPDNEVYPFIHYFIPIEGLSGIRQLGFLSNTGENSRSFLFKPYPHEREDHTWGVTMTADEMAQRNGISGTKLTTLRFATLLHDIATPAGGDTVKAIDKEALDEETHWRDVVGYRGKSLINKRGVDLQDIDRILKNEGTLGQLLDAADIITYVTKDVYNILGPHQSRLNSDYDLLNIRMILAKNPLIGNIYKDVGIEQTTGDIYFNNPDNLFDFLKIRAILHKNSYMHPLNMGRDMIVGELVTPYYSRTDTNKLTPKKLRDISDAELMNFLGAKYKTTLLGDYKAPDWMPLGEGLTSLLINTYVQYEKVDSLEEAARIADQLEESGQTIVGLKNVRPFKTDTHFKVATENGIAPFKEAYAERVKEIDDMAQSVGGSYVFYLNASSNREISDLLAAAREKAA